MLQFQICIVYIGFVNFQCFLYILANLVIYVFKQQFLYIIHGSNRFSVAECPHQCEIAFDKGQGQRVSQGWMQTKLKVQLLVHSPGQGSVHLGCMIFVSVQ